MAHLRWLIKVFPEINFLGFRVPCQKMASETAVHNPTLCLDGPSSTVEVKFSTLNAEEAKAKHKKQTRGGKKKEREEKTEPGAEKGQTKEPTRRLQENWQALEKPGGLRMKRKQF